MNKNKSLTLRKTSDGNNYWPDYPGNRFLSTLAWMFDEGKFYLNRVKEKVLITGEYRGLTGNAIDAELISNNVYIKPLYSEDADDYQITIEKNQLIKLIDKWLELIKKNPDEIIMKCDEHGNITFEGIFKNESGNLNN